jgi:glycosyltransferase involved in cell wall biosynthesis
LTKTLNNINTLSILIPVYNEEKTIEVVLEKVCSVQLLNNINKEIIIVNDGSKDSSSSIINSYIEKNTAKNIKFIDHNINKGKGHAIKTAIAAASGEYLIIQDADLEYDPEEFNLLLKPVINNNADVVYGSRFMGGEPHRILFFWHSIGNAFLTFMSNMFTNLNLTDMETCYKMIRTDYAQSIDIKENAFGIEPEITAKLSKINNICIYEVGISYYGRTYAEGKKINWKDGLRALYCILKYRFF